MVKTIVITGSSKGIGLGLAREFLKRDCRVVISARNPERLEKALADLAERFDKDTVRAQQCDVTSIDQVASLWQAARDFFGTVDVWINNAGIDNPMKPYNELTEKEITPVLTTNLLGMMYGSHVALKGMLEQGHGQIYNVDGYGSNDMMRTGYTVYGTTKRGLKYFTESLAREMDETPVQICTLSPGMVVTDFMIDQLKLLSEEKREEVKAIYNMLADSVETVTPFLADGVLQNTENNARIAWLTEEKINERFNSEEYMARDLFSEYGL